MFPRLLTTLAFVFVAGCAMPGGDPSANQQLSEGKEQTAGVGESIYTASDLLQIEYVCQLGPEEGRRENPPPIPVEVKWIYSGLSGSSIIEIAFEINSPESEDDTGVLPFRRNRQFDLAHSSEVSIERLQIHVREATEDSITFVVTQAPPISAGVSSSSSQ